MACPMTIQQTFFLSPNANGSISGLTQTLVLGIMNRVFYHCAVAAGHEANFANVIEVKAAVPFHSSSKAMNHPDY
jgi:hypothetical protein